MSNVQGHLQELILDQNEMEMDVFCHYGGHESGTSRTLKRKQSATGRRTLYYYSLLRWTKRI